MSKLKDAGIIVCGMIVGWFSMDGISKLQTYETDASISFIVALTALLIAMFIIGISYYRRRP